MKFLMYTVDHIKEDNIIVGRNTGDEISKGDTFIRLFDSKLIKNGDEVWSEITEVDTLLLKIDALLIYGKNVDAVPSGYVCQLKVEGEIPSLTAGQVLGNNETLDRHRQKVNALRSQ